MSNRDAFLKLPRPAVALFIGCLGLVANRLVFVCCENLDMNGTKVAQICGDADTRVAAVAAVLNFSTE